MLNRLALGLINFFVGLAEIFLGLRFILRFFDANAANQFVHWIYTSTNLLLEPFRGIFPPIVVGHHHIVDFSTLFAMAIYAVFGMILVWFVGLLHPRNYTSKKK